MSNALIAPVTLTPYDPKWPGVFEAERNSIVRAIGKHITSIEHIGSTSIPGMLAKPEIDILIGVTKIDSVSLWIKELGELGYPYYQRFEEIEPQRRYFRKSDGIIPLIHVHVYEETDKKYTERIVFRDYLRTHPEVAADYIKHKEMIIEKLGNDRPTYSDAKSIYVVDTMKKIYSVLESHRRKI